AGGVSHRAAAPAPLAALLERGRQRGRDAARGARHLALQPLPALLDRPGRATRRLLLRLRGRPLRVGHAARARGAPVAGPAMRVGAQRLRIVLALPALAGIFLLGQAILDRRAWRLDLPSELRYTLSDPGRKILDGLPAAVHVMAFLRAQDPRNLFIRDLLRQVTARSRRVQVEYLDVNRSPALARQYGVDSYGALVVESEGRRRVFSNPREEVLMAALLQVTRQQRKTVGWVLGHGEGDPNSGDHPILGPLDAPPVFSLTRSVGELPDDTGAMNAVRFLHTSPASWATTDTSVLRTGSPAFVAGRDRSGPVTVGLEVAFRTLTP